MLLINKQKKHISFIKIKFLLFSLLFILISQYSLAQENNANEVLPSLKASADITLPDGRNITIHREAQTGQTRNVAIYFHRPILAFEINENRNTDHPLIWGIMEMGDYTFIQIKLVLSTPEFRELARTAVIEEDPSIHVESPEISGRDIDVRPWPIKLLRLEVKHSLTHQKFGENIPESLSTSGDAINVSFKIPNKDYDGFLKGLKKERIRFTPSYTYKNAIVAFARSATNVTSSLSPKIENELRSLQIEEGDPIFQSQRDQLENSLNQTIITTIQATDSNLMAHITPPDITNQILKPETVTFDDLRSNRQLLNKVEEYLSPIIRRMSSETVESQEDNDINQTTTTRTINGNIGSTPMQGSANFAPDSIGGGSLSGNVSITNVRTLEDKHKVTFTENEATDVIEPHSIEISYLQSGWQDNLLEVFQTIYLAVGRNDSFEEDSGVNSSFTVDNLSKLIESNNIFVSPHASVPKGVPMLSFRADIPKGWVALDGSTSWPEENWVPEHLRGQPVPDMRGSFARGLKDGELIGHINSGGEIVIPKSEIKGSEYSLDGKRQVGALNALGEIDGAFERNNTFGNEVTFVEVGVVKVLGFGERKSFEFENSKPNKNTQSNLTSIPVDVFNGNISGKFEIPEYKYDLSVPNNQPTHAIGQWIIRIK